MLLALVLSIGLFATSCSDDNEGETLAPLAGKWNITKVGSTVSGQEILIDPPQNESGCAKDYLELKLDNTATEGDYDSSVSACALETNAGIYSRSHNNLTTVIDGVTTTKDIVNLTLSELKVKDANGAIIVYTRN
ncbi:lipocalin family protein [Flavobacterium rhamnosiphilum]|nr:lipocalin family protein [Flavobacterium rhamnosiphilum]